MFDMDRPRRERGRGQQGPCCRREMDQGEKGFSSRGPGDNSLEGQLLRSLDRLSREMRAQHGERGGQRRVLALLSEEESMTQRELTERLGTQPGSVSEIIGKLERAGLLRRSAYGQDRRTAWLSLTEEGRIRADELVRRQRERPDPFACLSREEKETLLALLDRVGEDWQSRRPRGMGRGGEGGPRGRGDEGGPRGRGGEEGPRGCGEGRGCGRRSDGEDRSCRGMPPRPTEECP